MIVLAAAWLLVLLPLPLLVHWVLRPHQEPVDAVYAPFAETLAALSGRSGTENDAVARRTGAQFVVGIAAWMLVVLALARPQFIGDPIEQTVPTRDLLLAVDLSGSMSTEDFTDVDGNRIDRLRAVKQVLDAFMARREGDRIGLILFGSAPFLQIPFTDDLDTCRQLLDEVQLGMAGPRTVVGDAIGLAINVFESSELEDRVLIVLTDGNDTGSAVPPDRAGSIAAERGIVIHTVAVGDPTAVGEEQIDIVALEAVANATGGQFARAEDRAELEAVYERLDEIEVREVQTISHRPRRELFHWPLGVFAVLVFGFHALMAAPRWWRARGASSDVV